MSIPSGTVKIRAATEADYPATLQLINSVFRKSNDLGWMRGFHNLNPSGDSILTIAEHPTMGVVAYRSIVRFTLNYRGKSLAAGQGSDAATHPEFRGQGLYSQMSAQAFQQFFDDGGEILYSFPGPRSYPILVGRFRFRLVKKIRHCIHPLRAGPNPVQRILNPGLALYRRIFSSSHQAIISPTSGGLPYGDRRHGERARFNRSQEQQKWRFQAMGRQYHEVRIGDLPGFAVVGSMRRRGRNACTLVDLEAPDGASLRRLLAAVPCWAEQQGYDLIYTWLRQPLRSFLMAGFVPLPSTTKFIVRARPQFQFPELLERGDLWDLSLLDTDAY